MNRCFLCPRRCGGERDEKAGSGICGVPSAALVARAAPHFGEEPCISGSRGSGAVFFTGCALGCVFCQNYAISRGNAGKAEVKVKALDLPGLRRVFLSLRDQGVHNLNLVTPSHYSSLIARALDGLELGIPVIWNSSGYETVEQLRPLEGLVQVYMPDFKYADPGLAARCSNAPEYPETALAALREMYRQTGPFRIDADGMLVRGLLIRHLVLPGAVENSLRVMDAIEDNFPAKKVMFSLMGQYTPMSELGPFIAFPPLGRRVTEEEYSRCLSYLEFSGLEYGYIQELDSATEELIPLFDGTGVI